MKYLIFSFLLLLGVVFLVSSCEDDEGLCVETTWYEDADGDGLGNPAVSQSACDQPEGYVADNSDSDDTGGSSATGSTPVSAFDDFNADAVTVSFDGDEITIESNALPHHTSPYWDASNSLYIDPVVAVESEMSPGRINEGSYTVTVPASPQKASNTSATGLGAIGISITGAPIFNDEEGPNVALSENVASGFDYAGGHMGPTGYHYHLEAADVSENTLLSHDDDALVGILQDGFLIYGRRCNSTGDHPTDLDESGGHTSSTQHSDGEEFYHCHIINEFYIGSYILLFGVDLQGTPNAIM
ncbi:YHYH protein [Neolewinella aurantiaca]|uniref:YHYH protein n=1 Tax=Neolewinella aurantiaca TaxID=2602767 RepID=A0A5C7FCY1_9BACT|nr:YHYH protein [Neolewinella aurantiaca]TXF88551.1 YHYH protein [Neolewinella aurantiaca]